MTIIIDPQNAGISGNMIVGALVNLGADENKIKTIMEYAAEDFGGVEVHFDKINKSGIESTYCNVKTINKTKSIKYNDLIDKIDDLDLDLEILEMSKNVFERLAQSESKVHGKSLADIHFHEVGAADAVADIIGSISAYFDLKLDEEVIIGLPIALGGGTTKSQHGQIPIPSPATMNILKGAKCFGGPINTELATPTGSAIYMEICDEFEEFIPTINPINSAYGAGTKDFDFPNVLRIIETEKISKKQKINVIETNIDHLSGEDIGYLFNNLLVEGASDVCVIPTIMKKNRPGYILKIISKEENTDHLVDVLFKETGTLGIRISEDTHRSVANREILPLKIEMNGQVYQIRFKIGFNNDEIISYKPEFEDIKIIAINEDMALSEVRNIANTMIRDYLEQIPEGE
ncbi:nickel pincer cofactor biosynthesis protein LarC [Methanobrevibacter sp. OttesenSCG-928-K11]|nr:nickel pincer cofactor biosynthesis protein LarC [Methanobrevibacter sp. OttesenSCG-928-K11]MDL2270216.1 nickel pincer cofactor biosynthesis protein LarC [Methanobrevibacter sp. OttesenSCG-928-I08]